MLCLAVQPGAYSLQGAKGFEHPGCPLLEYLLPSVSRLAALVTDLPLSLPPCQTASMPVALPKREERDVPALPGVAFLVPHSYSGMKLGLQL